MAWAPDYADLTELKSYVGIGDSADTEDDDELQLAVSAASRAIDRAANRQFGKVEQAEARYYEAVWDRHRGKYVVEIDDLMTATNLVVADANGTAVAATDYTLEPRNAPARGRPWTQVVMATATSEMTVTAEFGWTDWPATIKAATLLQGSRFFKRADAPFGVAGSPEVGSELRLLARVDPDVAVMVGAYKRWWAAA